MDHQLVKLTDCSCLRIVVGRFICISRMYGFDEAYSKAVGIKSSFLLLTIKTIYPSMALNK